MDPAGPGRDEAAGVCQKVRVAKSGTCMRQDGFRGHRPCYELYAVRQMDSVVPTCGVDACYIP